MNISNKIQNKRSSDPFDILIFEKGLRIKNVMIDKDLDLMLVVLNNGFVVKEMLSDYPSLKNASIKNLNDWRLISGGIGISWKKVNEDLSLKGFLKNGALQETLRLLQGKGALKKIIA
ncbi:DUF2442 domain-containing protein [Terrimonas pollutisoli]|uniref:DUF2442 domain-containing protein n=1 Tax=Terrimonas pollutisoli TaxID=3034147 RepID=UPI0023EBC480|nr:DUF2442 domain-containing protein [Terrimonas sp. H1YJ31]